LLLSSTIFSTTEAQPDSTLSFHGVGITVELIFPEEAHPEDNIDHNVTITSQTTPIINNLTLTIYGTINQTYQEIANSSLTSWTLNDPLTNQINFNITKETIGRLYCTLYVKTNQDTDYYFTSFFTTQVNPITFSELLTEYSQLLSEYEILDNLYQAKKREFDSLSNVHSSLEITHQSKINEFNDLLKNYTTLNLTSIDLQGNLTILQDNYNSLNENYIALQDAKTILDGEIINAQNQLNTDRNLMIVFIIILVSLIGLIIYLRNKQKEPYVVIRKETVSMKPKK
jgi:hypothetical protein